MSQAMPQTYETLLVERRDRVAIITINRPDKRNALNIKTREEGAALLEELRNDPSVGVVVITGAGDKAFIAGADIAEFAGRTAMMQREVMTARSLFTAIDTFPKPIIAMINGYCLGGGCELALACDLRIASETASFGQPEINLGIIPGGGGTQRLARLIGPARAKDLVMSGRMVGADEALAIGLADRIVPAGESVYDAAVAMVRPYVNGPAQALRAAKLAIDGGLELDLERGLHWESQLFASLFATDDRREGMTAFLDPAGGDYRLKPASRLRGAASDGRDVGADIASITIAIGLRPR